MVQPRSSNEADLRDFFIKYGPFARECYGVTSTESDLKQYRFQLHHAITRMSWDDINRVVSKKHFEPNFDDETSFLVVLIQPAADDDDDERINYRPTIITRTILRLLWKAHRAQLKRRSRELFHLFSKNRETSVIVGWLFEAIIHDLLEESIDVPMAVEQNNRANAVNGKHAASDIATKRWQSSTCLSLRMTAPWS